MKLIVLESGSRANGYILTNGPEALLLEAGVRLIEVKKALDFDLSIIQGCIVSHSHADHARYIGEYAKNGITVLGPQDIFPGCHHRYKPIIAGRGYVLGGFRILPFKVHHDVTCFGYLVDHEESGRILFITDAYLCEYVFTGLRHIIIEANYSDEILEENIFNGAEPASKRERLLGTHMELQTTRAVIMAQDLGKVQNIILIHLSDNNASERMFVDELVAATGRVVVCARGGLEVDLRVF